MRIAGGAVAASVAILTLTVPLGTTAYGAEDPPGWAYPANPPDFKPYPDDGVLRRVPQSSATYPLSQLRDLFLAPDWHPEDHPAMPEIVAMGRKPEVFACGYCHRADGPGGPENANIAGLPAAYIVQQLADYKSGARSSSLPNRGPQSLMIALSRSITDAEVQSAAAYFSALKPRANLTVIETDTVPRTFVAGWFLAPVESGEKEPIGGRIIEVPEDLEQFEHRDARSRFIAYVPTGSIAKGEALVSTGGAGKTTPCATCHGRDLKGVGGVPPISGRSPSYVTRQLYDIQSGARAGVATRLMQEVVAKLTVEEMMVIAAYLASRAP